MQKISYLLDSNHGRLQSALSLKRIEDNSECSKTRNRLSFHSNNRENIPSHEHCVIIVSL